MSERLKSNDIPNEAVIEDLTKNLEFSLRPEDEADNIINPESKTDDENSKGDRNETNLGNTTIVYNIRLSWVVFLSTNFVLN